MYIADYNSDFQHFSTVPTPTNTIASPPPETMGKYWIQIFITGVSKYELRWSQKKTLEAFFYSFLLKSALNAAFLTLHFNSLIFGPHEKIGSFEIDPKPKIALCGGSVVKQALHFFLAANHRPPSAQVSGASAQDPNFSVVDVLFVSLLSNAGQSYMRNGL